MSAEHENYCGFCLACDEPWPCHASDETMVDLGGGMVVPLRELMEDE